MKNQTSTSKDLTSKYLKKPDNPKSPKKLSSKQKSIFEEKLKSIISPIRKADNVKLVNEEKVEKFEKLEMIDIEGNILKDENVAIKENVINEENVENKININKIENEDRVNEEKSIIEPIVDIEIQFKENKSNENKNESNKATETNTKSSFVKISKMPISNRKDIEKITKLEEERISKLSISKTNENSLSKYGKEIRESRLLSPKIKDLLNTTLNGTINKSLIKEIDDINSNLLEDEEKPLENNRGSREQLSKKNLSNNKRCKPNNTLKPKGKIIPTSDMINEISKAIRLPKKVNGKFIKKSKEKKE